MECRCFFLVSKNMLLETVKLTMRRVVLLNYREDGITPYVAIWKHGLKEMKV